jgi:transcriptional regulator with XRE-family HTH domain
LTFFARCDNINKKGCDILDFLERLDSLMEVNGLNRNTLSAKSKIPYTTIDGWYKKGYEKIRLSTLKQLASFFSVTLDYLIYGEEKTRPQLSERVKSISEQNETFRETVELLAMLNQNMIESVYQIAKELSARPDH